jgi:tetratricopeptide (TPR) repeat protein
MIKERTYLKHLSMLKKFIAIILFLQCLYGLAYAQNDSLYQVLVTKAGLCELQKDYVNAIRTFDSAFNIRQPDALNAYKAAAAYSLFGDSAKSFQFLKLAIDSGWTDAAWLSSDPDFSFLRTAAPIAWQEVSAIAFAKEQQFEKTIKLPELRKSINQMTRNDQQLRFERTRAKKDADIERINQEIQKADAQIHYKQKQFCRSMDGLR